MTKKKLVREKTGRKPLLSEIDVMWLRQMHDISHKEAAKQLGVSYLTVYQARFGITWGHLSWPDMWVHWEDEDGRPIIVKSSRKHPSLRTAEEQAEVNRLNEKAKWAMGELILAGGYWPNRRGEGGSES